MAATVERSGRHVVLLGLAGTVVAGMVAYAQWYVTPGSSVGAKQV